MHFLQQVNLWLRCVPSLTVETNKGYNVAKIRRSPDATFLKFAIVCKELLRS